ncbi:MAG: glycosyltransferase [Elusimicrobiales bacterium]
METKNKIRVLQILGAPTGGIRKHVHSLLFGLDSGVFEQSYTFSNNLLDEGFKKDYPRLAELLRGRLLEQDIRKRPAPGDLRNLLRLVKFVRDNKIQIVHGHGAKGGAYARLLKLFCNVKTVYTPHGGSVHKMFSRPEEFVYTAAEKFLFRLTDYFIFESNYSAEAYFSKVGRKSENWIVNYNGISEPDLPALSAEARNLGYAPAPESEITEIGVFGVLRRQKGQLYALKAAAELKKGGARLRLHFFGNGPDLGALGSAASELGIMEIVVFHGEVADPAPHMCAMDIILIPSLFESFGYVAVEAFSLEKPVVAAATGGLREIVTDGFTGLLVKAGSYPEMAVAIKKLIDSPAAARKLAGAGASLFLEKFSEKKMVAGVSGCYRKLLGKKVAVVCDWLVTYAGAERVLEQVLEVLPEADLFSLIDFLPRGKRGFIKNKKVKTSFLQYFPFIRNEYRSFLPLMSYAVERLDVGGYDLVVSISHAVAKGVKTRPGQKHICICCSPMRYAWDLRGQYLEESGLNTGVKGWLVNRLLDRVKAWDLKVTPRVTDFIAISEYIGKRIEHNYGRDFSVIYPPVYVDKFVPGGQKEDFYLTASRMVPYKRIPLIVEAFAAMPDKKLVVIGDGPEFDKVRTKSAGNIEILGYQPDEVLRDYMQRAKAFVFAAEEDFGIAPLEAQACGTPVIAYGHGAVRETVVEEKTGLFFDEQSVQSIVDAVRRFESAEESFLPSEIRKNAELFSTERFKKEFADFVAKIRGLPSRYL